jgi:hypothetical protein
MNELNENEITFNCIRSFLFRTIFVQGVWGSVNPSGKFINITVFNDKQTIPITITNEVVDNKLGKEINHQFRVDGKIDREMEADLVLPLDVAEDFYTWLGEKILQCKALQ